MLNVNNRFGYVAKHINNKCYKQLSIAVFVDLSNFLSIFAENVSNKIAITLLIILKTLYYENPPS